MMGEIKYPNIKKHYVSSCIQDLQDTSFINSNLNKRCAKWDA